MIGIAESEKLSGILSQRERESIFCSNIGGGEEAEEKQRPHSINVSIFPRQVPLTSAERWVLVKM